MAIDICTTFHIRGADEKFQTWENAIHKLQADEIAHPENAKADEEEIELYRELEQNLKEMLDTAEKYRNSKNDLGIAKELNILTGRDQTLTQRIKLDDYIRNLKEDSKNNPQHAAANADKIANAQQQKQCIEDFQIAWEAYQNSGNPADGEKVNFLIQELQALRNENRTAPNSSGLSWQDFQFVVDSYTILEFQGHKYAVTP